MELAFGGGVGYLMIERDISQLPPRRASNPRSGVFLFCGCCGALLQPKRSGNCRRILSPELPDVIRALVRRKGTGLRQIADAGIK
jgi:hypothetical protein